MITTCLPVALRGVLEACSVLSTASNQSYQDEHHTTQHTHTIHTHINQHAQPTQHPHGEDTHTHHTQLRDGCSSQTASLQHIEAVTQLTSSQVRNNTTTLDKVQKVKCCDFLPPPMCMVPHYSRSGGLRVS